jgi:mannosyltransferase
MSTRPLTNGLSELTGRPSASAGLKHRTIPCIALGLIIAVAAVLRFAHLGAKSIWSDEAFSISMAKLSWSAFFRMITTSEANMSLYYFLLRGWIHFGDSAWWVRSLSALMGVATVPVVYCLGREIFSRRAGLLAAFLLAINLFHIQYSQQARSYSLVVLLVAVSFLSFLECVKQQPRVAWTICYVLSTTLALYAHFFTALVVVTQVILTLIVPDRRRIAISQLARIGVVLVLGSPVFWFVLFRNHGQLNWIQPLHPRDLYHFLLYLTGSGVKFGIALIGFIVASKISLSRWRARGWNMQTWSFIVVAAWLFLPVCVAMLVSIWKPIYSPRFLIFCLPAALLLVAYGLTEITYPWITYALIAIWTFGAVNPIRMYYAEPGPEDWKSVVEFLSRNTTPGDTAYVPESYCALPLNYALNQASPQSFGLQVTSTTPLPGETGRIWIIECSVAGDLNPQTMFPAYNVKEVRIFTAVHIFKLDKK